MTKKTLEIIFQNVSLPYAKNQKFLTLYSGGKGSFLAACLLKSKGYDQTLYFNDTFYEHDSLYVFLDETLSFLHEKDKLGCYKNIPSLTNWKDRRLFLKDAGKMISDYYDNFIHDSANESLHEVISRNKFMPNSRVDLCSRILKRERSAAFVKNFSHDEIKIAIGIGIWEEHRVKRAKERWLPYHITSPFCEAGEFESEYKDAVFELAGLIDPYLYQIDVAHNNCAGFCVKAGLKHYRNLLEKDRDLYLTHERNEQALYEENSNLKPFLKKTIDGNTIYITLKQFRENIELNKPFISENERVNNLDEDYGSCSCAI